jgi:hypothetical protein
MLAADTGIEISTQMERHKIVRILEQARLIGPNKAPFRPAFLARITDYPELPGMNLYYEAGGTGVYLTSMTGRDNAIRILERARLIGPDAVADPSQCLKSCDKCMGRRPMS